MTTSTVNDIASLYPVVHDLTDAEYADEGSGWCTSEDLSSLFVGCFSIQDLVRPVETPRPASSMRNIVLDEPRSPQQSPRNLSRQTSPQTRDYPDDLEAESDDIVDRGHTAHDSIAVPRLLSFHDVYVLIRQINRGGYSAVWETVHRISGTRYATKIFDRRMLSPKEDAAAKREVKMLKQLGDSAIGTVCLIESFEDHSHFYLIMDYVEGTSLHSLVQQRTLSEKETKRIAKSLLQGVRYLHNQGICHRNLKPDNILLSHDGCDTTIADFGLAAFLPFTNGEQGSLTGRCGSATYTAPEVQQSLPYDCSSDMWTVGVVLYFCIAGRAPFVDKSKRGLLRKIIKGDYSFSSKRWSGVSHSAKRFIASLLKVDPNMRLTAEEALYHPWLINSTPLPPIKEEPPPPKKTRKLSRVFKVLRGNSQSKLVVDDDSVSSHTMSLASAELDDSFTRGRRQNK